MKAEARGQRPERQGAIRFDQDGFEVLKRVLIEDEIGSLAAELSNLYQRDREQERTRLGGVRNLLRRSSAVADLAASTKLKTIVARALGGFAFPVKALFFDKTAEANWRVPWHQDVGIAVRERIETEGFGGWSFKEGILHVQPPREILEQMVAIRLHLDDCDADNGALAVLPGSHLQGRLSGEEIDAWVARSEPVVCEVPRGGALLMRPLLIHSSSPSRQPFHRRVLHIEYAATQLPNGLKWFDCQ